jgi:dienelactone hydrolase
MPQTFEIGGQKYPVDRYMGPGGAAKRPVVVMAHGVDGMGEPSATEIRKFAEQIAADGYLVFTPHYFDANDGSDTLPIEALLALRVPRLALYPPRIAAAISYATKDSHADGARVGLIGLSLGGGLMLDYAESAPVGRVKALVDFFGYVSDQRICDNANRLPPTLILHNANDGVVQLALSSQPLLKALDATTVPHDHCFYTDDHNPARKDHPFLPGGKADVDSRSRSLAWLKKYV